MRPYGVDFSRLYDVSLYRLISDERGAAIHVLTLVITLFCRVSDIAACTRMCGMLAYIGIDATGLGVGVFQLVRSFYPAARDIRYTPEMKTAMVLKAKDVIRRGCLEYDVSATDITSSFMAIRKTMTSSGRSATYEASRSEEASHADLAWATMHALLNEPLTAGISTPLTSTILEFY